MEQPFQPVFDSRRRDDSQPPVPHHSNKQRKILKYIKKFWYVLLLIGIALGLLIGWQVAVGAENSAWKRATEAFGKADYGTAKKEIEKYGAPSSQDRLKIYSQTMLATRTLDKALVGYEKLYGQTKDPATLLIIGNIYNQQQDYDKAISKYKEVIANNAGNIQAYVNLATVYKLQGNQQEAIAIAKQSVDKNPKSIVALELLVSMTMENKNSPDYKKAVDELKKLNPNDELLKAINA